MDNDIKTLTEMVKKFNNERDWDQFHNPKDLLLALMSEIGELAECYRWLTDEEIAEIHSVPYKKQKIEDEMADILMYLITLSYKTDIDLFTAVENKLKKNRKRYPVDKAKGIHSNPIEGFKPC